MTPQQCKESIIEEHRHLVDTVRQGKLNQSAVSGIIESSCMSAAQHNGIPEC